MSKSIGMKNESKANCYIYEVNKIDKTPVNYVRKIIV